MPCRVELKWSRALGSLCQEKNTLALTRTNNGPEDPKGWFYPPHFVAIFDVSVSKHHENTWIEMCEC